MKKLYFHILVLLLLAIIVFIPSCGNSELEKKLKSTEEELEICKSENEELKNTAEVLFSNAEKQESDGDFDAAILSYQKIIEKFKGTENARIASEKKINLEKELENKKREEDRKKLLGFKAIPEQTKLSINNTTLNFTSVTNGKTWTFDSNGNKYSYKNAEKDQIFIVAKVAISSSEKNPKLPPIMIYVLRDGKLRHEITMEYRFVRWKDYGSYLGNYADYSNDFAHTSKINFTLGAAIFMETFNKYPVFIVVRNKGSFERQSDRFSSPPVWYENKSTEYKSPLKVEDFDKNYSLVKIFNKNKL